MLKRYGRFIAQLQLRRFRTYLDLSSLSKEERVFTTLSIAHILSVIAYTAAVYVVLLRSDPYVMRFIMKWIETFRIQEIFEVDLISASDIWLVYHWIVIIALAGLSAHSFFVLLRYLFSVVVLTDDRMILVKSNLLFSQIHQVPYNQILRLSTKETLLHRLLRIGTIEIQTGERSDVFRFGPVGGFQRLIALATQELTA